MVQGVGCEVWRGGSEVGGWGPECFFLGKIRYVVGEAEGGWFSKRVSRKVGDGTYTLFLVS